MSRQGARAGGDGTRCADGPGRDVGACREAEAGGDICPRCGAAFACGIAGGACWCAELPPLPRLPVTVPGLPAAAPRVEQAAASCLCPACLRELIAAGAAAAR